MSDLALNILLKARDSTQGVFGALGNSLQTVAFGFRNLSTEGNIGMGALMQGASGLGAAFLKIAAGATLVGVAVAVGIGAASVKAAGDWQQSMTLLVNSAGESQDKIKMVGDGLLQVAVDTGTSTKQIATGMFNVESAGYHGQAGLLVMKAAAMGAKVENSDLASTTDVLTTSMHNYHLPASQAIDVMNSFRLSASMGKMHMDDLSQALKNVLPIASQAGVKITDVEAAISTMSNSGDKGAAAGTHLSQMFTYLLAPSSKATKALKSVGLTTQGIADEMKVSLPGAVSMITDAVGKKFPVGSAKYIAAISAIVGGNKSMKAILEISGKSFKEFNKDASDLGPTMKANSTAVDGFALVQQNLNFKVDQAKVAWNAMLITIGQQLLPVMTTIVTQVAPLISSFTQWLIKSGALKTAISVLVTGIGGLITAISATVTFFQRNQLAMDALKVTLTVVAVVIGVVMVIALYNMAVAAWAAMLPFLPIIAIILAVIAVITLIVFAVQHWGQIAHWLQGVWAAFSSWFMSAMGAVGAFFTSVWGAIGNFFKGLWNGIISWFKGVWSGITGFIGGVFNGIRNAISSSLNNTRGSIVSIVTGAINWLKNAWQNCVIAVVQAFIWLYNHNYYFKDLVDAIRNVINTVVNWLKSTWQTCVNAVATAWNWLKNTATTAWNAVVNAIKAVVNAVVAWLKMIWTNDVNLLKAVWDLLKGYAEAAWNAVVAAFHSVIDPIVAWLQSVWETAVAGVQAKWSQLSGMASTAWNAVTNVFQSAWGGISSALSSLWSNISGWFNGIVGQMASFGSNMIQSFIGGINSMLGAVGNAASNVANTVKQFLGFHSPAEKGPGAELMQWPVNMVKSYAAVLVAQKPVMEAAVAQVAQAFYGMNARHHRGGGGGHGGTHHHPPAPPPQNPNLWGVGLANTFSKDLSTNTQKAHSEAERIMSSLLLSMRQHSDLIAKMHLTGNKAKEKQLQTELSMEHAQMRLYREYLKQHGDKLNINDLNNPINFSPKKKPRPGLGPVYAPTGTGGISTGGGGGGMSGASGSGSVGTQYNITNEFNFAVQISRSATPQDARQIADMVEKELNMRFRRQGSYTTTSSGGSGQ